MPTRKRRLQLSLPDDLTVSLVALSRALDRPVATIVVSLLVELQPQLDGLTKVYVAARSGNKVAAKRALVHMVGDNLAELMAQQLELPTRSRK